MTQNEVVAIKPRREMAVSAILVGLLAYGCSAESAGRLETEDRSGELSGTGVCSEAASYAAPCLTHASLVPESEQPLLMALSFAECDEEMADVVLRSSCQEIYEEDARAKADSGWIPPPVEASVASTGAIWPPCDRATEWHCLFGKCVCLRTDYCNDGYPGSACHEVCEDACDEGATR